MSAAPAATVPMLRADAARNVTQLRAAAIAAFHGRGLGTPLDEIAAAAGLSKGTIYARFGGRAGLIDAVIGELVAARVYAIVDEAAAVTDPWGRVGYYVEARRELQYTEPAFTDALLMSHPDSAHLVQLARRASAATTLILRQGRAAGVVRPEYTAGDLYYADIANGLALRARPRPRRTDYDRRTGFLLDSMRPR